MSNETTIRPKFPLSTWLMIASIMAAIIGSYTLAQSQIADHDKRITRLETRDEQARLDYAAVRELLVRIDERTAEIKRKQEAGR